MQVFLGLDIGTTNCKALLMDEQGLPLAIVSEVTPERSDNNLADGEKAGYDANDLWMVAAQLVQCCMEKLEPGQKVAGVCVASMGEAGVLIDAQGQPLVPILTWHDQRTLPWVDWWQDRLTDEDVYRITGMGIDYTLSASKLLWYRKSYPQAFSRASSWLCAADWVTYRLCGALTTSYSMASRTMLFDLRQRDWSHELLKLADLPLDLLPPALPSGEVVGRVTQQAADETGLQEGTPVVSGGHDHICAALAAGVITPGPVLDSVGTAEAMLVTLDQPVLEGEIAHSGLCCGCHTVKNKYYLLGGVLAGAIVDWVSRICLGDDSSDELIYMMEEARQAPVGSRGAWFFPYLDGSGPPYRDPTTWGSWLGLRLHHQRGDLLRAALEGLSYSSRGLLELLQDSAGYSVGELHAVGGGTRNALWQQIKANVLGRTVYVSQITDVTAQGAALLAALGVGFFRDEQDAVKHIYHPSIEYSVDPEQYQFYDKAYRQVFTSLYSALHPISLHV